MIARTITQNITLDLLDEDIVLINTLSIARSAANSSDLHCSQTYGFVAKAQVRAIENSVLMRANPDDEVQAWEAAKIAEALFDFMIETGEGIISALDAWNHDSIHIDA